MIESQSMPFIVGAPRSGTTLLRFMLDSHPLLAIPPETGFLSALAQFPRDGDASRDALFQLMTNFPPNEPAWQDFGLDADELKSKLDCIQPFDLASGFRAFYRYYASRQNKCRYGDKTPIYALHVAAIRQILPEARFIHIIRDGRDTALSLRKVWFTVPDRSIPGLANYWKAFVCAARASAGNAGDYMEVRYEDLVRDPEPVLQRICAFVDLPFDSSMLRYFERTPERLKEHRTRVSVSGNVVVTHEQRLQQQRLTMEPPREERIFQWKEEMTPLEQAEFWETAGGLLEELGYER
jgi:hypothetical protein